MADTLGGVTSDAIHGWPPGLKQRVATWQTPGIAGYGAQLLGLGDGEFQLSAVKFGIFST
ncbi:MAG: hypothetical protein IMZ55_00675, partial [Acidobacteria bacterium]|nr:hypothetical protein [Acidobacteriota bacterium]